MAYDMHKFTTQSQVIGVAVLEDSIPKTNPICTHQPGEAE
jgi:hypothetical protein